MKKYSNMLFLKKKKEKTQKLNIYYHFSNISTAYRQLQYENIPIWM